MSFILDALKKSEHERQKKSAPKISSVLLEQKKPLRPKWYRLTVFLLLLIITILLIGITYPNALSLINKKQEANLDLTQEKKGASEKETSNQNEIIRPKEKIEVTNNESTEIFNIDIVNSEYNFFLPELHIDIHVFSEIPAERFVFINMKKYNEGDILIAGPVLETITLEGAVLSLNDILFLLPKN